MQSAEAVISLASARAGEEAATECVTSFVRRTAPDGRAALASFVRPGSACRYKRPSRPPGATMLANQLSAGTPCRTAAGSRAAAAASRRAFRAAAPLSRVQSRRVSCAALPRTVAAASFSVTPPARDLHLSSLTAVTPLDGCGAVHQRTALGPAFCRSRRLGSCQRAALTSRRCAASVATPTRWRACATCSASTR